MWFIYKTAKAKYPRRGSNEDRNYNIKDKMNAHWKNRGEPAFIPGKKTVETDGHSCNNRDNCFCICFTKTENSRGQH